LEETTPILPSSQLVFTCDPNVLLSHQAISISTVEDPEAFQSVKYGIFQFVNGNIIQPFTSSPTLPSFHFFCIASLYDFKVTA
jgi:hypothetical protein